MTIENAISKHTAALEHLAQAIEGHTAFLQSQAAQCAPEPVAVDMPNRPIRADENAEPVITAVTGEAGDVGTTAEKVLAESAGDTEPAQEPDEVSNEQAPIPDEQAPVPENAPDQDVAGELKQKLMACNSREFVESLFTECGAKVFRDVKPEHYATMMQKVDAYLAGLPA